MSELTIGSILSTGSQGEDVKRVQEWLCLNGINVKIDGDFGSATEAAVGKFQSMQGRQRTGVVDNATFDGLVRPMRQAVSVIPGANRSLGEVAAAYAEQHLAQNPREIGGPNCGPWVRLYMNGHEGVAWYWCAGFVSFVYGQASTTLNVPMPFAPTFSCDNLATESIRNGSFLAEPPLAARDRIRPGAIFLNKRTTSDWDHTGIVVAADRNVIHTIEGNTNDDGSRDGYEVCRRIRGYKGKDFVLV